MATPDSRHDISPARYMRLLPWLALALVALFLFTFMARQHRVSPDRSDQARPAAAAPASPDRSP